MLCRTAGCSPSIPLASLEQAVLGVLARESDHFQNLGPVIQGERQKQGALDMRLSMRKHLKIEMCCVDKPAISPLEYYDRTEDINEKNKLLRCLISRVEYCRIKDGSRQFSLTIYPLEK